MSEALPTTLNWAGIVGGAVTILTLIGGGINWLWKVSVARAKTRAQKNAEWEAELDRRETEIEGKVSAMLKKCEARCDEVTQSLDLYRLSVHLLLSALERTSPHAPELEQVRRLLRQAIPLNGEIPSDMRALLDRLNPPEPA